MSGPRILIAGVGRSGTSFLFEELSAALRARDAGARLFYEPYLWGPAKVNATGRVSAEPFDTRNLSPFGIAVHCGSPLFLDGPHPEHDRMIDHVLGDRTGAALAKVIRGNGRLGAWLAADPELKVVGVLRDAFGTVNSAANHFSFFGEEFHPTDRPRFAREVEARTGAMPRVGVPEPAARAAVWSAEYWKAMTAALLDAAQAHPGRVLLIDYESLRADPDAAYGAIAAHTGLNVGAHRLQARVGIVSGANYLAGVGPAHLEPFADWYRDAMRARIGQGVICRDDSAAFRPVAEAMEGMREKPGVVPRYPPFRTVLGWRYDAERRDLAQVARAGLEDRVADQRSRAAFRRLAAPAQGSPLPEVSVIVPMWKSEGSLEATVASVWDQAGVKARVVLVDDASPDGSAALAERLLALGPGTLIRNTRNLGPALARHRGIMGVEAGLVSTLDADDVAFPLKLAAEVEALEGDARAVAYSDVLYQRGGGLSLWDFAHLEGIDRTQRLAAIAGRTGPLPRDMTFDRALYARTRGFDATLRMYEDFAFKIELAAVAGDWRNSGEVGMRYDHAETGASAAGPGRHLYALHAAFLKNADLLVLGLGGKVLDALEGACRSFGTPAHLVDGLAFLRRRARFAGHLLGDMRRLHAEVAARMFHEAPGYDAKLAAAYAALIAGAEATDRPLDRPLEDAS
ncbi:glycosyltransferase family 2 protein [Chachezhania sediminis]|uniref:glycosyltransferase family 2 protein n=1 Tax=Chachezhania sediminis TaxID=2599291 RepID=UPI00131A8C5C|nr:glycosyltransferase family 2 protein [Chachezhania sediminis]